MARLNRPRCGLLIASGIAVIVASGCSQPNLIRNDNPINSETQQAESEISPLGDILAVINGYTLSEEERQIAAEARWMRFEELVSECMNDAGFEYIPVPLDQTGPREDPGVIRPDDRDWVAQYGFQIVNRAYLSEEAARVEYVSIDPNIPIIDNLSDAEREAYWVALDGAPPLWEGGCRQWANEQPRPDTPADLTQSPEFAPLFAALDEMYANLENEMPELEREWSSCMADAGHPGIARPWDAAMTILDAYDAILANQNEEFGAAVEHSDLTSSPELAELADLEIELALADFDCRQAIDFEARVAARRLEAETQFYNDHRAELHELRDAAEQLTW